MPMSCHNLLSVWSYSIPLRGFITVERISALLCAASINIFMALLVRIVVPQTIPLTFLNCLVLLSCISLARGYDETCIYYLPFVDNQAKALQICVEMLEQLIIRSASCQLFSILPYRSSIRDIIDTANAYEITKLVRSFIWYSACSSLNPYNRCTNITLNINTGFMGRRPALLLRSKVCSLLSRMGRNISKSIISDINSRGFPCLDNASRVWACSNKLLLD